jgi:hypothetical protein
VATKKLGTKSRGTKKRSARGPAVKKSAKKTTTKKSTRKAAKRTLIAPRGDKRYVRRSEGGRFKESDDVSRSLSSDRRKRAKRKATRGQGDRGD